MHWPHRKWQYFTLALVLFLGKLPTCFGQMRWAAPQRRPFDSNHSALSNLNHPSSLSMQVLGGGQTIRLQQDFEDLNREFEMRQKFNLLAWDEVMSHQNRVNEFSREVFNQIRSYQVSQVKKKLIPWLRELQNEELVQIILKPLAALMAGVGFYLGDPLDLALSEDIRVLMQAHFPTRRFQLILSSPFLESSLDWTGGAIQQAREGSEVRVDPLARSNERFRVSFSKLLPWWGIYTGIYYGSSSKFLGASLSKPLFLNLNCVFDVVFPLDSDHSEIKQTGEAIRLSYHLNF
jgi:hypothetical protein